MRRPAHHDEILVIGAGIGGLAAALRLTADGHAVRVIEAADEPGGKLRTVPSSAGPVDAGPTVMTLRPVFEEIFAEANLRLSDFVTTIEEPLLARHWWPDGASLDLFADVEASASAVRGFGGKRAEADFRLFHERTRDVFRAFEQPVMKSPKINVAGILSACVENPRILRALLPGVSLWRSLTSAFGDARLRQLFARYATYVGGSPFQSPALLSLIWQAEAGGVWRVDGGMAALAKGFERAAEKLGVVFEYGQPVARIGCEGDDFNVTLSDGSVRSADCIVFNGDPAALQQGLLGQEVSGAVRPNGVSRRSLSAYVWSFAARPSGRDLTHHNVFFNTDYRAEFEAIARDAMPSDATLYVCAQDRGDGLETHGAERFEIIMNAAPVDAKRPSDPEEYEECLTRVFTALSRHGLDFDARPERSNLTTPRDFAARFPGSGGSLYGRSPHGMMAAFQRPGVRSRIPGLYLAGGGVNPGAGLPMAATSGRLAAEAILTDRASTSRFRRTVMPGGMSMGYRTTAGTASRSSPS
ncbi:MAG: 1-hydroxycarotenoid 3,4-desaturase CrtD [Pseudomonadota bacterium]